MINFSHQIIQYILSGEASSCDVQYAEHWRRIMLPPLLQGYAPNDIFNLDEAALFFQCLPNKTLEFKGKKCHGVKVSKQRITIIPICNMSGSEKLPLIVIGKSKNPHCFRKLNIGELPVDYYHNKTAWMTSAIFHQVVTKLDDHFDSQGRKIILFADNCSAHKLAPETDLKAIKIEFLPPNYTSLLQPLDAGIIKVLKHSYRKRLLRQCNKHMTEKRELKKITLLDAINILSPAWSEDVKSDTIANCFRHAGFGKYDVRSDNEIVPNVEHVVDQHAIEIDHSESEALVQEFTDTLSKLHELESNIQNCSAIEYMDIDDGIENLNPLESLSATDSTCTTTTTSDENSADSSWPNDESINIMSPVNEAIDVSPTYDESVAAIVSVQKLLQRSKSIPDNMKGDLSFNSTIKLLLNEYDTFH